MEGRKHGSEGYSMRKGGVEMRGRAFVNFDQAATSFPKPEGVYLALDQANRRAGWSVGRTQGTMTEGIDVAREVQRTRELLLQVFDTDSARHRVVFTATATEAINGILKGLPKGQMQRIYTTPFEHRSVTETLKALSVSEITHLSFDLLTMTFDLAAIEVAFALNPPSLVVLCHLSNVLGVITPIAEIARMAKAYGAVVILDACQSAGRIPLRLEADFLVFSGHKSLMGPFGIAGFLMPVGFSLLPLLHGGHGDSGERDQMDVAYEVGTQNSVAILGLQEGLRYVLERGVAALYLEERALSQQLWTLIAQQPFLEPVYRGEATPFAIISCATRVISQPTLVHLLTQQGVLLRWGLHCSDAAHALLGTTDSGLLRFSINAMTAPWELEALAESFEAIGALF